MSTTIPSSENMAPTKCDAELNTSSVTCGEWSRESSRSGSVGRAIVTAVYFGCCDSVAKEEVAP